MIVIVYLKLLQSAFFVICTMGSPTEGTYFYNVHIEYIS